MGIFSAPEPTFQIVKEPPQGYPEFLVAEIHLPKVVSLKHELSESLLLTSVSACIYFHGIYFQKAAASLTLDVGEDRIVLSTRTGVYGLDKYLPYNIVQEECGAQFDRKTKVSCYAVTECNGSRSLLPRRVDGKASNVFSRLVYNYWGGIPVIILLRLQQEFLKTCPWVVSPL